MLARCVIRSVLLTAWILPLLLLPACETPPPGGSTLPAPKDTAPPPDAVLPLDRGADPNAPPTLPTVPPPDQPGAPQVPATMPAIFQPITTQPAVGEPGAAAPGAGPGIEEPAPDESSPLPEYLIVLDRFTQRQAYRITPRTEPGNRLVLDTQNVQRLRIDRPRIPLDRMRSIILVLDGQVLEWVPRSEVTEFERSVNGVWSPVRPGRAGARPVP